MAVLLTFIVSDLTMAVLSTEHCGDVYEETKPRWKNSLRTQGERQSAEKDVEGKPMWKPAPKATSPSARSYAQGGSLRTQRRRWVLGFH